MNEKEIKQIIKENTKQTITPTYIVGNLGDISAMLLSAERYALGRRTYITQWTCEFIANNMHLLTESNKKVMIRDIEQCENYGDKIDKQEWIKLLEILKNNQK